ncbi:MAG: hypothetical protein HQL79_10160 [Magnetococcales bacterium]|nr:hypothetical protein [Magnetococcales bacterium]
MKKNKHSTLIYSYLCLFSQGNILSRVANRESQATSGENAWAMAPKEDLDLAEIAGKMRRENEGVSTINLTVWRSRFYGPLTVGATLSIK